MINFLLRFKYYIVAGIMILALLAFSMAFYLPVRTDVESQSQDTDAKLRSVTVESAVELSEGLQHKNYIGTVQSLNEADLRAESAGTITNVFALPGYGVSSGSIIASISNASEAAGIQAAQAQIESAKASVAQATAVLNKVLSGTRSEQLAILESSVLDAQNTFNESTVATQNSLYTTYATVDSSILRGTDTMFVNPSGANPYLHFQSTNYSNKLQAENKRLMLSSVIARQEVAGLAVYNLTSSDAIRDELDKTENELREVKIFLDNLLLTLDGGIVSATVLTPTFAEYKTIAESARTTILAAMSSLSVARSSISRAETALSVAKENQSQAQSGARSEDIEASEAALALARAGLSTARAGLASANAIYEKTLIRTPISGVLTTLPISKGDFVNMYESVGTVANENTLEILTYISAVDSEMLSIGDIVVVDGDYNGTVTNIAAGINPVLGQIQIRIALNEQATNLIHGQSVNIDIPRTTDVSATAVTDIKIPVVAVKFEADKVIVFSVVDNYLVANNVELGKINGDLVTIVSGLEADLAIVTDARGLHSGQYVKIK